LAFLCGLGFFWLICTKSGLIRHPESAWLTLGSAALLLALVRPAGSSAARCAIAVIGLAAILVAAPIVRPADSGAPSLAGILKQDQTGFLGGPPRQIREAISFVAAPEAWFSKAAARKQAGEEAVRTRLPLPSLTGPVDIIEPEQSSVLAHHLEYRPRPSFQDYGTYTPRLNELNRRFFASERAPEWVIFNISAIDGRYPALTEGASWPELLGRYKPDTLVNGRLFLKHGRNPVSETLGAPDSFKGRLGTDFTLPEKQPSFVRITVTPTLAGRVLSAFFRPGRLQLVTTLDDGSVRIGRLIAGIAESGFVLSPWIGDAQDFQNLALGKAGEMQFVRSARVEAIDHPWEFGPEIAVEVRPLAVPPAEDR
jgi:hypothetical protein